MPIEPNSMNDEIYKWSRVVSSGILEEINSEWNRLLDNTNLKESDYHQFISQHPAFLLCERANYLAISKLKLGAEYVTDFVVLQNGYSAGNIYELIEIESPHVNLFDSKGNPTAKFNAALQQIRDWKRFLREDKTFFKKVFPTIGTKMVKESRIKFRIIIGRRTDNIEHLEKRQQIAEQEGIEIQSFDRLTDFLSSIKYFFDLGIIHETDNRNIPILANNELANPFFKCISDSQWRAMNKKSTYHFYSIMVEEILKNRMYNDYFDKFKEYYKQLDKF